MKKDKKTQLNPSLNNMTMEEVVSFLLAENEKLRQHNLVLEEAIKMLTNKKYGKSSEKTKDVSKDQLQLQFDEVHAMYKERSNWLEKFEKQENKLSNLHKLLETVIKWISGNQIEDYMGKNQHKENAQDLWVYFTNIIEWVESVFSKYRKEMKGLSWGEFYNKYKSIGFNSEEIEERVSNLYEDLEIKNNKGIYQYILTGDSKYLNLRTFEDHVKKSIYEKQKNKCAHCKKEFPFNQMHADHIKPWSLGGKTEPNNCQILCQSCNAKKSDNY